MGPSTQSCSWDPQRIQTCPPCSATRLIADSVQCLVPVQVQSRRSQLHRQPPCFPVRVIPVSVIGRRALDWGRSQPANAANSLTVSLRNSSTQSTSD
ncbi:hypothetical protein M0R45_033343 [Rubus argutus]|uniref:Uncharacterized protein n=1 Tax=Rubus argutus TaxID=59490 RepID=A0AAW1WKV4_RUBAR